MKKYFSLVLIFLLAFSLTACGAHSASDGNAYASYGDVYYASNGDAYYYASNGDAYYLGNIYASDGDAFYYSTDGDAFYYATDGDAFVTDGNAYWTGIFVATDGDAADCEMYLITVYDSLLYDTRNITPEEFARALVEMVSVMTPEEVQRVTVDWLAQHGNDDQTAFADSLRSIRDWCIAYSQALGQEKNESLDTVFSVVGLR